MFSALGNSALTSLSPDVSFSIPLSLFLFLFYAYISLLIKIISPGFHLGGSFFHLSRLSSYHIHIYSLFLSLFSFFHSLSRSLLFLRRLKAIDQRRNVYGRYELLKSNRYTTHTNGTFSDGARVASNSVTPRRVAPRREFSRSLPFGMDEARRVTAASSHEIQSRIFAPDRKIFEGRHKRSKSRSRNLLPHR